MSAMKSKNDFKKKKRAIRHFQGDDSWLQLPEFILFVLSYLN